ncbi:MAG: rhomboid family intramembrane serine protease [Treponema sp.]|nr:rhomboid family intramembrane serine protease [Treponema sp.]
MAKKKKAKLKIVYNAPVTLTFSLAAVLLLVLNQFALRGLIDTFFTVPGKIGSEMAFNWSNPLDYVRLFTHVLGHGDWNHLLGNLSFILLLGPLLEERYGSPMLVLMMSITALVTGVVNVCFFDRPMVGASGIAFMMILLSSFTAISKHQIPLTFLLVFVLYVGRELVSSFLDENVSYVAHIAGGLCGSLFGFLTAHSPKNSRKAAASKEQASQEKAPSEKASPAKTPTAKAAPESAAVKKSGATKALSKKAPKKASKDDDFDIYEQEATILFGEDDL